MKKLSPEVQGLFQQVEMLSKLTSQNSKQTAVLRALCQQHYTTKTHCQWIAPIDLASAQSEMRMGTLNAKGELDLEPTQTQIWEQLLAGVVAFLKQQSADETILRMIKMLEEYFQHVSSVTAKAVAENEVRHLRCWRVYKEGSHNLEAMTVPGTTGMKCWDR